MDRVFIYWDNSNIFIGAQAEAEEREGVSARHRVRVNFRNMMKLASAERPVELAGGQRVVAPESHGRTGAIQTVARAARITTSVTAARAPKKP